MGDTSSVVMRMLPPIPVAPELMGLVGRILFDQRCSRCCRQDKNPVQLHAGAGGSGALNGKSLPREPVVPIQRSQCGASDQHLLHDTPP